MAIKLPEKDYFTRDEIAQQWCCDVELVSHYVSRGLLREAVITARSGLSDLHSATYFQCDANSKIFKSYRNCPVFFDDLTELLSLCSEILDIRDVVACPEFAYLADTENMLFLQDEFKSLSTGDMLDGITPRYWDTGEIYFLAGPGDERYIPVIPSKKDPFSDLKNWCINKIVIERENFDFDGKVIPRSERDRFERLHNVEGDNMLTSQAPGKANPASTKEENNRYRVIAIMLELLTNKEKRKTFASQEQLKDYLTDDVRKVSGLSKRNLDLIFAKANKYINGEK